MSSVKAYVERVRGGDMGALPALCGLIVLCAAFSALRPVFLTPGNVANLFTQGAAVTIIAMGLVFVLLLGEIDLSAGFTSGVCAAVLAVLLTQHGLPWYLGIGAAIGAGVTIGLMLGLLTAKIGIPSFVVTLAAFLAFQGVVLMLIRGGVNISINDSVILSLANQNLPPWLGWTLAGIAVAGYATVQIVQNRRRASRGLIVPSMSMLVVRIAALATLLGIGVGVLNFERSRNAAFSSLRGVPIVIPLIAGLLIIGTLVLGRTVYGRYLYAVGGNVEAARRAGINVDMIRVSAFAVCSTLAAIGGIVAASRANSVDAATGGSNVLLYAVGAAVIGGTSLFGGKGRLLDAVLGGAVVAVIDNGMGLLGYSAGVKFVITGLVLMLAAGVDALSRRRGSNVGAR